MKLFIITWILFLLISNSILSAQKHQELFDYYANRQIDKLEIRIKKLNDSTQKAVIGAHWNDSNGSNSGSAHVFTRDAGGIWSEQQKLTASDGASDDDDSPFPTALSC